jgi:hypothetical protein
MYINTTYLLAFVIKPPVKYNNFKDTTLFQHLVSVSWRRRLSYSWCSSICCVLCFAAPFSTLQCTLLNFLQLLFGLILLSVSRFFNFYLISTIIIYRKNIQSWPDKQLMKCTYVHCGTLCTCDEPIILVSTTTAVANIAKIGTQSSNTICKSTWCS